MLDVIPTKRVDAEDLRVVVVALVFAASWLP